MPTVEIITEFLRKLPLLFDLFRHIHTQPSRHTELCKYILDTLDLCPLVVRYGFEFLGPCFSDAAS